MSSKTNFGLIKYQMSNLLGESYVNDKNVDSTNKLFRNYLSTIKTSPILAVEYVIYSNLENKTIKNESSAIRYIDENIKLMMKYSQKELINEHQKLKSFNKEIQLPAEKKELYENINTLINESIIKNNIAGIDKIHESLEYIISYLKKDKPEAEPLTESPADDLKLFSSEQILKFMVQKYNKKYISLSENEKSILKVLVSDSLSTKKEMFENLKTTTKEILNNLLVTGDELDKVNECVKKLDDMSFNESNLIKDVVKLIDLRDNIIEK